jgi:hypothetical protein
MNDFRKELLLWSTVIVIALIFTFFASRLFGGDSLFNKGTGPLYTGDIDTDLNLQNVFDKSLISSELIVTDAAMLNPPGAIKPGPPAQVGEAALIKYFKQLYPNMPQQSFLTMKNLYLNLDCWYEKLIPEFAPVPSVDYKLDRLASLTALDKDANLVWDRLFDGNLCDCIRVSLPQCLYSENRLRPEEITECPNYPGLRVQMTLKRLLQIAYDSNNTSKNTTVDVIKHTGMTGLKGFPDNSWYEGLTYPGEYGVPILCTATRPPFFLQNQKGLNVSILNSEPPWFSNDDCATTGPACPTGYSCVTVTSDGSFGPATTKDVCLRTGTFKEMFIENLAATDLNDNCSPPFPENVCSTVRPANYRGYYTYPLRGCGLWFPVGKSIVCNTKLGFLVAPESEGGCGINLESLMALRGTINAPEQNINSQVGRLTNIIQFGSVTAKTSPLWPALTLADLQKHGYSGGKQSTYESANAEAKKLVIYWYVNGYTGIENGIVNGANYNYSKYFPIGTHFAYASRFDNLILSALAFKGLDTIQLLLEPQNAVVGLRPAYMNEILSARPTTDLGLTTSVFPDTSIRGCKTVYSLNPAIDLTNYIRYGYIDGSKVQNPPLLDANTMTMRAEDISFSP